jgi:hypothetical protein
MLFSRVKSTQSTLMSPMRDARSPAATLTAMWDGSSVWTAMMIEYTLSSARRPVIV